MGWYVHLSITYNSDSYELPKIQKLAEKHIANLTINEFLSEDYDNDYCLRYLEAVKDKANYNMGGKGELFTWGLVGNRINVERFIETLDMFFKEMLQQEIGIDNCKHIIVFEEPEQSNNAHAYEIMLNDNKDLEVKHHICHFKWNQG